MAEPNGGLTAQGREELRLVASLGLGHVIAQEAERKAKDILRNGTPLNIFASNAADAITGLVERLIALERHVVALEQHTAELEAKMLTDGGVWKPEKVFEPNQLTTYRGLIWRCLEANTNARPGTNSYWRMMQKTDT